MGRWTDSLVQHTSRVKRAAIIPGIVVLLCLTASGAVGCERPSGRAPDDAYGSMVDLTPTLDTMEPYVLALGQYVGDGKHIISVLNYEDADFGQYRLDDIWAWTGSQKATVQAIDPRTGATVITVPRAGGDVAVTGDASKLRRGQKVTILSRVGASDSNLDLPATVVGSPDSSTLIFQVSVSELPEYASAGWRPVQGSAVVDGQGRVVGLVGASYDRLMPARSSEPLVLPVVTINSILKLLSSDTARQPWASGPAVSALATSSGVVGYTSGILTTPAAYNLMTSAVRVLMNSLGSPLAGNELPDDYPGPVTELPQSHDGNLLTLVYPDTNPIALESPDGTVIRADWIGIEWGRAGGRPNVVYYGFTPYLVAGGFVLTGNPATLEQSLH